MRGRSEEPELELLVDEATGGHLGPHPSTGRAVRDFERFYRAEYPKVVRTLVGLTGRRSVAEELAQEAMLSAYGRWARLQAMDRPDLWVRRVAVNRAISTHRRVIAEVAAVARVKARGVEVAAPADPDDHLWAQVRALPARQRAALVLWAVEGFTFDEVG
ncbi:MAG: RNA polymerase sigma factor, partial [Acidimicrobiales bacterium]